MMCQPEPELRIDPPKEPEVPKGLAYAQDVLRDLEYAGKKLLDDGLLTVDEGYLWRACCAPLEALVEYAERQQPARRG